MDHECEQFGARSEATPGSVRCLRGRFEQWLQTHGPPAALVDDLALAVYEALANVVEHAYHPHHPHPVVQLKAHLEDGQLLITVTDHGCWRTPREAGNRGRGLAMMRYLTDLHLVPTTEGTTVHMRAALPVAVTATSPINAAL